MVGALRRGLVGVVILLWEYFYSNLWGRNLWGRLFDDVEEIYGDGCWMIKGDGFAEC